MNLYLAKLTNHKYGSLKEDGTIAVSGESAKTSEIVKYNMFSIEKLLNGTVTHRTTDDEEETTMEKQNGDIGGIPYNIDNLIDEVNREIVDNYYGSDRAEVIKSISKIYCMNEAYIIAILYLYKIGALNTEDLICINKPRLISLKEFLLKKLEETKRLNIDEYFVFGPLLRDIYKSESKTLSPSRHQFPDNTVNTQTVTHTEINLGSTRNVHIEKEYYVEEKVVREETNTSWWNYYLHYSHRYHSYCSYSRYYNNHYWDELSANIKAWVDSWDGPNDGDFLGRSNQHYEYDWRSGKMVYEYTEKYLREKQNEIITEENYYVATNSYTTETRTKVDPVTGDVMTYTFILEKISENFYYNYVLGYRKFIDAFCFVKNLSDWETTIIGSSVFVSDTSGNYTMNGTIKCAFDSVKRSYDYNTFLINFYDIVLSKYKIIKLDKMNNPAQSDIKELNSSDKTSYTNTYKNAMKTFVSKTYTNDQKPYIKLIYKIDEIIRYMVEQRTIDVMFSNADFTNFFNQYGDFITLPKVSRKYNTSSSSIIYYGDNTAHDTYIRDFNEGVIIANGRECVEKSMLDLMYLEKVRFANSKTFDELKAYLSNNIVKNGLNTVVLRQINTDEEQEHYYSLLMKTFDDTVKQMTDFTLSEGYKKLPVLFTMYFVMLECDHYYRWLFNSHSSFLSDSIVGFLNNEDDTSIDGVLYELNTNLSGQLTNEQVKTKLQNMGATNVVVTPPATGSDYSYKITYKFMGESYAFYIKYDNGAYKTVKYVASNSYISDKLKKYGFTVRNITKKNGNEYDIQFNYRKKEGKVGVRLVDGEFELADEGSNKFAFVPSAHIPQAKLYPTAEEISTQLPKIDQQEVSFMKLIRELNVMKLALDNSLPNIYKVSQKTQQYINSVYSSQQGKVLGTEKMNI